MTRLKEAIKLVDEGASLELCVYDGTNYIYINGRKNIQKVINSESALLTELREMLRKKYETQANTTNKRDK